MRVMQIYNEQRAIGGEDAMVAATVTALRNAGVEVILALKSSRSIEFTPLRKMFTAATSIWNPFSARELRHRLRALRPDVVHIHNVHPNWSPAVATVARAEGVPSVLHVHSQNLTCPNWYHIRNGRMCELCLGGREYNCLLTNCRGALAESAVYALRSAVVRSAGMFRNNVARYIVPSNFMRERLARNGYPRARISVVPNTIAERPVPDHTAAGRAGYVGYVGRLSCEKGVELLAAVARRLPEIPFAFAGDGPLAPQLRAQSSANIQWVGRLGPAELTGFYRGARMVVVPSIGFETFCLVALEAMAHARPVVAARIGALPEVVHDGVSGVLFDPGNADELSARISQLWSDAALCERLGQEGRRISDDYVPNRYGAQILGVYLKAMASCP